MQNEKGHTWPPFGDHTPMFFRLLRQMLQSNNLVGDHQTSDGDFDELTKNSGKTTQLPFQNETCL